MRHYVLNRHNVKWHLAWPTEVTMQNVTLRQLEAFLAVAEELHFSTPAGRCAQSQAASTLIDRKSVV